MAELDEPTDQDYIEITITRVRFKQEPFRRHKMLYRGKDDRPEGVTSDYGYIEKPGGKTRRLNTVVYQQRLAPDELVVADVIAAVNHPDGPVAG